ncbi:MAG: FKBP-type peptidyl-prolyl cis-trans isomerase [Lachnospiraceae bacterium]|nr:FKBP-type peptidyl-prolyl cis-trans isomerase [Lachnospiraceae bacterium]
MKNRFLITALSAVMAVGMISCGNPAEPEEYVLTTDNVDQCIRSIGQYKGLKINITRDSLTDDAIDYYTDYFFEKQASSIEGWKAAKGDKVVIDYVGSLSGSSDDAVYGRDQKVEIGKHTHIKGFEEALIGATAGDELTFTLSFPDDYKDAEFAGKPCDFIVQVKSVIPGISDEAVAALNSEVYRTAEEYRVFVYYTLKEYSDSDYRTRLVQEVLKKSGADSAFNEIPEGLINRAKEAVIAKYTETAAEYGLDVDKYLEYCNTSLEAEATEYAKQQVLIYKIASDEGLVASAEESDAKAVSEMVSDFIVSVTNQ